MACGKLLNKKRRLADGSFTNFASEIGHRSTVLSKASRNIIGNKCIWDWSREQIKKRLVLVVTKNELKWDHFDDNLCDILLDASKTLVKNIMEEAVKMKRSHLVSSSGICHMFGARKRRVEGECFSDSYVLLPMKMPLRTADVVDTLRADCRFISNTWVRLLLMKSLESQNISRRS